LSIIVKGLDGVEFVLLQRGNSAKRSSALIKKEWMIVIFRALKYYAIIGYWLLAD
jgi:hypothetical protein